MDRIFIIIILVTLLLAIVFGPFVLMFMKGKKLARTKSDMHKVVLYSIFWFSVGSWAVVGAGGHGVIAFPLPNIIAIPLFYVFYDSVVGGSNYFSLYGMLFPTAHVFFPLLHLVVFYLIYYIYKYKSA